MESQFNRYSSLFKFVHAHKFWFLAVASSSENDLILSCLRLIEQKVGWGSSDNWSTHDFEVLGNRIAEVTDVNLSVSTLKRIWGKVKYDSAPTISTLNALARFLGFENWHSYREQKSSDNPGENDSPQQKPDEVRATQSSLETSDTFIHKQTVDVVIDSTAAVEPKTNRVPNKRTWMLSFTFLVAAIGIIGFSYRSGKWGQKSGEHYSHDLAKDSASFSFKSRKVAPGIPNSVVFDYDASSSVSDSIFIQQSWDPARRVAVNKNGRSHTSIYYEPGFYQAKLVIDSTVVKEHPLVIGTEGWLALIPTSTVPVYIDSNKYHRKGMLTVSNQTVIDYNIPLRPSAPILKYFNVGNFASVPLSNLSFSCRINHTYVDGSAPCRYTWIALITDAMPIVMPLSTSGCVSELGLMDGKRMVSGKTNDLSKFGVNYDDWIKIEMKTVDNKLFYLINGETVYTGELPGGKVNVVGLGFGFQGTGAIKEVTLYNAKQLVFSDLN